MSVFSLSMAFENVTKSMVSLMEMRTGAATLTKHAAGFLLALCRPVEDGRPQDNILIPGHAVDINCQRRHKQREHGQAVLAAELPDFPRELQRRYHGFAFGPDGAAARFLGLQYSHFRQRRELGVPIAPVAVKPGRPFIRRIAFKVLHKGGFGESSAGSPFLKAV